MKITCDASPNDELHVTPHRDHVILTVGTGGSHVINLGLEKMTEILAVLARRRNLNAAG
jgi:hypothetical protein